jgi:RHS repeat-associated protein
LSWLGSIEHWGEQAVGDLVSGEAQLVGDGLNAVGLHSWAQAVDTAGNEAGFDLGADVPELQLGQTSDPAELVHGDPASIRSAASRLRTFSSAFGETATGLSGLDTEHWTGAAADAFRAKYAPQPPKWQDASSATGETSGALESYADSVASAQNQATRAIDLYDQGQRATAAAAAAYNQNVAAYNSAAQAYNTRLASRQNPGTPPTEPAPYSDPGEPLRQAAQQLLSDARSSRNAAAASAARVIGSATELAPAEPSFLSQLGDDLSDTVQAGQLGLVHLAGGAVQGVADIVKFARSVNPEDQWNLEHPAEYTAGLSGTLAGLVDDVVNPADGVKSLLGSGWGSDPFAAAGRLVPNVALAVGSDGAGLAADAGGDAALGAGEDAAALSGAGDAPGAATAPSEMTTAGDPVDVATGDVILAQADVTLPGSLPLVLERVHRSSQRAGRWFGRSWMSSLDQRLAVTGSRVTGAFASGQVLTWPRPGSPDGKGGESPALPVTGPAWPLRQHQDGSYTVTDPQRGLQWRFERRPGYYSSFNGDGELPLVAVSDRAGHQVTYEYDAAGRPASVSHPGGPRIGVTVAGGRVTGLALSGSHGAPDTPLTGYEYDEHGNLAGVINSSGQPLRFSYDHAGRLTGWQDRNGQFYRYDYDDQGRCVRGAGPGGILSGTFSYGPDARVTRWTDAAGAVTAYQISESFRVAAITGPLGHLTRWEHDERGRVTARVDPLGRATRYAYDARGNLTTVTRPDGAQVRAEYDEQSQPVRLTEPGVGTWLQEYDSRGNRTWLTAPDGSATQFGYDDRGHLARVIRPDGAVTRVACDAAGLPTEVIGPDGSLARYERDQFGRVSQLTAPDGGITSMTWTTEGLLSSRTLPDGTAERWEYDGEGNLVRHLNPAGAATSYEYGLFDQVASVTRPDGTRSEFSYDHGLRLIKVVHGGLSWLYDYDLAGRLVAETDYNAATTSYAYDEAGQLTTRVNACGQQISFRYDQLGSPTERVADDVVTTYAYDLAGRLIRARNPDADLRFDRDELGRVTAETCNGRTVTSDYDTVGRRVRRITPAGDVTGWEYDLAGQPAVLTASGHEIHFGYDLAGRETRRDLPGGLTLTQDWDQRGRLTLQALTDAGRPLPEGPAVTGQLLQRRAYSYRSDGFVDGIDDLLAGHHAIGLDPAGRVTTVTGRNWAEQYAYDRAGNVTAATWPAPPPGPAAAWLDAGAQGERQFSGTLISRAGNIRYSHDRQGRVTKRQRIRISRKPETWHYDWDAGNHLTAVTTPDGTTWRYRYDPLGRRTAKQRLAPDGTVAQQTEFTWDGAVLAEEAATTARPGEQQVLTWNYRPGSFTPLTQAGHTSLRDAPQEEIDQRFYAIIADAAGTPAELTSPDGTLAGYQQHTLWGGTRWHPDGAQTPLRFPGQYDDQETGLHYNNHRYYDPVSGSYLTPDPLGLTPAPNPHAYVPNPHVLIDPLGLAPCSPASEGGPALFRGTTEGYEGGAGSLKTGVTPASTDPKVATAFATRAEGYGQGVMQVAMPGDLAGLKVEVSAGYLPYEAESYVMTTPADFAARASITIPVGAARGVLREMGIDVPWQIASNGDLTTFLRGSPLMNPDQVAEFLTRIGG